MATKLRAALYDRVSTREQHAGKLRTQLRDYAERIGADVVIDTDETGTGKRNDRPELQRVLRAAAAGDVNAVLVWKIDRFGRSLIDIVSNVRRLRQVGARFVAVSQGIDLSAERDAATELQFNVFCAFAEYESDLISERTIVGLDAARRRGVQLGRPRVLTPQLAVDARTLRAEKMSLRAIAMTLGASLGTVQAALLDAPDDRQLAQLDEQLQRAYDQHNATRAILPEAPAAVPRPRGRGRRLLGHDDTL